MCTEIVETNHPCERCGNIDAVYVTNPYSLEIYDKEVMEWLCHDCYEDIRGDI